MKKAAIFFGALLLVGVGISGPAVGSASADELEEACQGQLISDRPQDQLGVEAANRVSTGKNAQTGKAVVVAVVDSGVQGDNPHFKGALATGKSFVSGRADRDSAIQGTAVAGLIAARLIEGESGVVGIAPDAKIMPVRVYESFADDAQQPDPELTAQGIEWAIDHGAEIIAIPHALPMDSHKKLEQAVARARGKALIVASAGNISQEVPDGTLVYPSGYTQTGKPSRSSNPVISVTAVDEQGYHQDGSTIANPHVELAAPGQNVLTTAGKGDCLVPSGEPSAAYATGYVAGAAALVAAAYPDESPIDWKYRLLATASRSDNNHSDAVGWGIVAPYEALNFVNDGGMAGPPNPVPNYNQPPKVAPQPIEIPEPAPDYDPQVWTGVGWIVAAVIFITSFAILAAQLRSRRNQAGQ
ncbi:MAG: S8 family serine peptidase [Propionibacteriaceae bacterium]|nr:S8 family serine peptidase [Propionibacteriaceae bacterium]